VGALFLKYMYIVLKLLNICITIYKLNLKLKGVLKCLKETKINI
jgi:hypothetical protein